MSNLSKNQQISPEKYIKNKSKDLPYHVCYATSEWFESWELVSVIVSKKMPSGKIIFGIYLLDKGCLGLKKTDYRFGFTEEDFEDFVEKIFEPYPVGYEEISVEDVHNLIYGAIDYAQELGFEPQKDFFTVTRFFLDEDLITDAIDDIPFGKDGKPYYFSGPYDNVAKIMATLRNKVGDGNFEFTAQDGGF